MDTTSTRTKDDTTATATAETLATTSTTVPPLPQANLLLETAGQGLTGRAKREAELAAMMQSLDQTPSYQRYTSVQEKEDKQSNGSTRQEAAPAGTSSGRSDPVLTTAKEHGIPVAQTFVIDPPSSTSSSSTTAATTCLAVDPSGSRFALGSRDFMVRLYDFSGMDQARRRTEPFQTTVAHDGYGVVSCVYSNTGDRLLVGTASAQPVVLDREGQELLQFVRGDVYVADQSKTLGHVAAMTAVDWHPLERDLVLTASLDGTARLWNLATGKLQFEKLTCHKVHTAPLLPR